MGKKPLSRSVLRMAPLPAILGLLAAGLGLAQTVSLENTQPLDWQGPLDEKMLDGLHVFIDRKLAASVEARGRHWSRDFSSTAAYESSVEPNRRRLRTIIGLVDERVPPSMERYGDDDNPALVCRDPVVPRIPGSLAGGRRCYRRGAADRTPP